MNQILIEIWVVCTTLSVLTRATDVDFIKELVVNSTKGVKEVKNGYCQDIPCFYLRRPFNDVVLPRTESESFISSLNRNQALSARFLFKQSKIKRQVSTLFSINVPGRMSPEMRLTLSPAKKRLVVYYNSSSNGRTHHKGVYLNHHAVFEWMHVFVAFTPDSLKIYVNYDIGLTMKIRDGVNLNFSGDSLIYFRQEPGLKRQFIGKIQVAKLSASKNFKIPWKCYEENHDLQDEFQDDSNNRRFVALEEQISFLNQQLKSLTSEMMQVRQTFDALGRSCVCANLCQFNGTKFAVGSSWSLDPCFGCSCQDGVASCNINMSIPECVNPCLTNPCQKGGTCIGNPGYQNYTCTCPIYTDGERCQTILQDNCCLSPDRSDCDPDSIYSYNDTVHACTSTKRDYCNPNPCMNDGICVRSRWPRRPRLITCRCTNGYDGARCQHRSSQQCYLPKDIGECKDSIEAWFYNSSTGSCQRFNYSGCQGNNNNFKTHYSCRVNCEIGACCYRQPLYPDKPYGFSRSGLDMYGLHFRKTEGASFQQFNHSGYDYQGYDKDGWNKFGIDRHGYNKQRYHVKTGFNLLGYNLIGDYDGLIKFDKDGYDPEGYDRAGFNCHGYDHDGFDYNGLSSGWSYHCRAMTESRCSQVELEYPYLKRRVVKFTRGFRCDQIDCEFQCGCKHLGAWYELDRVFTVGNRKCKCCKYGRIKCHCLSVSSRKEIREMSAVELYEFQEAVKFLSTKTRYPSAWQNISDIYSDDIPQIHGSVFMLPWFRMYLIAIESILQSYNFNVSVPYYDWCADAGMPTTSVIWQANYFGGDGNDVGLCVERHPFRDAYTGGWYPCLTRNFNRKMTLPTAVEIERMLRSEDYQTFRLNMEILTLMFREFVGGHLSTPAAAYDPIFIAHIAFIDKLYSEWMSRSGAESFPHEFRFIPIEPFGLSADDVLRASNCTTYVPLPEDVHCYRDTTTRNASAINGRSENSTQDSTSKEYGIDGFDVFGYDDGGFDSIGYDSSGYSLAGFNRDGYDVLAREDDLNVTTDGYDPYKFELVGLFRDNGCQARRSGRIYLKIANWFRNALKTSSNDSLFRINRTCTELPEIADGFRVWFDRFKEGLKEVFGNLRNRQKSVSVVGMLPPSVDERICSQLNYFYGCKPGVKVVPCNSSLCDSAVCVGQQLAKCSVSRCGACNIQFHMPGEYESVVCDNIGCKVNAIVKNDLEVWKPSVCKRCQCKSGVVLCEDIVCNKTPFCSHPVKRPDECCPSCGGCGYRRRMHRNREMFQSTQDPCIQCTCRLGNVRCTRKSCRFLRTCESGSIVILAGRCCPTCTMCGQRRNGDTWTDKQCRPCRCKDGVIRCSRSQCESLVCNEYSLLVKFPEKCCPVCVHSTA